MIVKRKTEVKKMSKYVFLGSLQIGLEKKLDLDEVKKIVEYYEGYIDEAIDFGKSEEEVLNELGNVDDLIIAILDSLKDYDVEFKDNETEKSKGFPWELDEMLSEVSTMTKNVSKEISNVMKDVGEKINTTSNEWKETLKKKQEEKVAAEVEKAEKLFEEDISEEILNEIGENVATEIEEALKEDQTEYDENDVFFENYELDLNQNQVNELEIIGSNIAIDIRLSDDDQFKAELINNEMKTCSFIAELKEGKLKLKEIKAKVYMLITINAPKLIVTIPSIYKGLIDVDCKNGKIAVDGQGNKRTNRWELSCKNGMVEVRNIVMGDVKIECKNGKVAVLDSIIYRAKINCKNGMLTYRMLKNDFGKYVNVHCKNGLIKTDNAQSFKSSYEKEINASKDTRHILSLVANCDNGIVRLSRFE